MIELEPTILKLAPEDGDVIVLRYPGRLHQEQRTRISSLLRNITASLGKEICFMILEDGASIEIIKTSQLKDVE